MDDNRWAWAIGGCVVLVLGVVAAIVALSIAQPDTDHAATTTLLLGLVPMVAVPLLALLKVADTGRDVRQNKATTEATAKTVSELANGSMDAKIRLAVAQVLAPHAVADTPAAKRQLASDLQRVRDLDALAAELRKRVQDE